MAVGPLIIPTASCISFHRTIGNHGQRGERALRQRCYQRSLYCLCFNWSKSSQRHLICTGVAAGNKHGKNKGAVAVAEGRREKKARGENDFLRSALSISECHLPIVIK